MIDTIPRMSQPPESPAGRATGARARHDWATEPARPGGIVVGSDGRPESLAAMRMAAALAARDGCAVHVVTALAGRPVFAPGFDAGWMAGSSVADVAATHDAVRELVGRATGDPDAWTVQLRDGAPGPLLATAAAERGADLVVVGLGLRRLRDRLLGGENVLRILRHAAVPVLAVMPDADRLPRTAVVAMDFSAASVHAARVAHDLIDGDGTLHLVHVVGDDAPAAPASAADERSVVPYGWLRRLDARLRPRAGVRIEHVVLRGDPAPLLLAYTERVRADLLAAGTQGPSLVQRLFVGSVSTALVRGVRCSVLVAPVGEAILDAAGG